MTRFETARSGDLIRVYLPCAGIQIDGNDLAIVPRFDLGTHIAIVDFVAAASGFILAVSWFVYGHRLISQVSVQ
jgi:hypothetical protein